MEISLEEKEAMEEFKREYNDGRILKSDIIIELDTARIVIALIDKLQKENQELKERNKYQYKLLEKFEEHIDKETIMKIYDEE